MLTTNRITLTLIIVNIIMLFLMLFKLPNYRMPGIITVCVLSILACVLILKSTENYKYSIMHMLFVIIPLTFLTAINVNSNYIKILNQKENKNKQLNILETLTPLLTIIQMGLLYGSTFLFSKNYIYGTALISILNFFTIGLLWREVNFYVTDG
tara:strand:+ start:520 stop:981 length:462 start_codon:yes stop_codon:yes gene_type:complete